MSDWDTASPVIKNVVIPMSTIKLTPPQPEPESDLTLKRQPHPLGICEILISQGLDIEKGTRSLDRRVFLTKYMEGDRPAYLSNYESVWSGDPYELIAYLKLHHSNWGMDLPPSDVEQQSLLSRFFALFGM
jgi:hypothetical protein